MVDSGIVRLQLLIRPFDPPKFVMRSVQFPFDRWPIRSLSGNWALNVPVNGAGAFWIGLVAVSSRVVFVKFANRGDWLGGRVNSRMIVPSGATSSPTRSGTFG